MIQKSSVSRYYRSQTHLNFNNTGDSANLVCGDQIISSVVWDYDVPGDFIVTGKNIPSREKKQKKKKAVSIPAEKTSADPGEKPEKIPFETIAISLQ